jgi:poly-gamma-glutamate synthesis protein (capsule biosynthesis protein)
LVSAPAALARAHRAGLRVVGIANNHMRDLGVEAPRETARALAQRGLGSANGGEPAVVVQSGRGVAITAHDLSAGVPPRLAGELRSARRRADDLVATFHVTGPPSYLPRPELREAAEMALEAGAGVVVAHGSHALGPVERRGEAVVAWGLGNLSFACDCTRETDALLLKVTLGRGPVEARVIPIDAGLRGAPARLAADPELTFDLLAALGSSALDREGATARLL